MQKSVSQDRHLYIGGSDIPIIMGLSPFKKRWQLLQEKAQLLDSDFDGNKYTDYGNVMEEKIRNYINQFEDEPFVEGQTIVGNKRYHSDGQNTLKMLEIKTTSQVYETLEEYKSYLVQLLFGMMVNEKNFGKLAVYNRLENADGTFDEEFYEELLQEFDFEIEEFRDLVEEIKAAVIRFEEDWAKLLENPELTEEDFVPTDIIVISNEIAKLETQMATFKEIEKKYTDLKTQLYEKMLEKKVKKWSTINGTNITLVLPKEDEEVEVEKLDDDKFKQEQAKLIETYEATKSKYISKVKEIKKGKKGYVLITLPKVS